MVLDFGPGDFGRGDVVAYFRGGDAHSGPIEIGVVKRVTEHGCFVAYGTGDTVSMTPFRCIAPVSNGYALPALSERRVQLGAESWGLSEGCEDWGGAQDGREAF